MEIFISWSGLRSKACAEALDLWLPRVIQAVKPWVSTHGITKGSRWSSDIAKQLDQHIYGVICVTPENRHSTWLNFEAGALSKTDASRTFTLLLGLSHAEVEQPLAQFNHTLAIRDDVFSLVQSVNAACEHPLNNDLLQHSFETNWEFLEERFKQILADAVPKEEELPASQKSASRDDASMIRETLELVRSLTSRQNTITASSPLRSQGSSNNLRRRIFVEKFYELNSQFPHYKFELVMAENPDSMHVDITGKGKTTRVPVSLLEPLELAMDRVLRKIDKS